jgi:nucleotide-binding universal stress UspA family protein
LFAHILIPLDLSRAGARPLEAARALARSGRARITLLHVIERIEHIPVEEIRGFYRRLERIATGKLDRAARTIARPGLEVRGVVLIGGPAQEIVKYAARNRVDLIVLGSHRVD